MNNRYGLIDTMPCDSALNTLIGEKGEWLSPFVKLCPLV